MGKIFIFEGCIYRNLVRRGLYWFGTIMTWLEVLNRHRLAKQLNNERAVMFETAVVLKEPSKMLSSSLYIYNYGED